MAKNPTLGIIADIYLNLYCSTHCLKRPLTPDQVKDAGIAFLDDVADAEIHLMLDQERESDEICEQAAGETEFSIWHMKTLVDQFVKGYFSNFEGSFEPLSNRDGDECVDYFRDLLFEAYRPAPDDE